MSNISKNFKRKRGLCLAVGGVVDANGNDSTLTDKMQTWLTNNRPQAASVSQSAQAVQPVEAPPSGESPQSAHMRAMASMSGADLQALGDPNNAPTQTFGGNLKHGGFSAATPSVGSGAWRSQLNNHASALDTLTQATQSRLAPPSAFSMRGSNWNFAQGGVVPSQADLDSIAKKYGLSSTSAPAPAPTPAPTPVAPQQKSSGGLLGGAIGGLRARQAQLQQALNYATGGVVAVQGPGTGTSDDIPATIKTGRRGLDINVSNGEGVAVLPKKTMNNPHAVEAVNQIIEQTNGLPPRGLRAGADYADGLFDRVKGVGSATIDKVKGVFGASSAGGSGPSAAPGSPDISVGEASMDDFRRAQNAKMRADINAAATGGSGATTPRGTPFEVNGSLHNSAAQDAQAAAERAEKFARLNRNAPWQVAADTLSDAGKGVVRKGAALLNNPYAKTAGLVGGLMTAAHAVVGNALDPIKVEGQGNSIPALGTSTLANASDILLRGADDVAAPITWGLNKINAMAGGDKDYFGGAAKATRQMLNGRAGITASTAQWEDPAKGGTKPKASAAAPAGQDQMSRPGDAAETPGNNAPVAPVLSPAAELQQRGLNAAKLVDQAQAQMNLPRNTTDAINSGNAGLRAIAGNEGVRNDLNAAHAEMGDGIQYGTRRGLNGKPQTTITGGEPTKTQYVGADGKGTNSWYDTQAYKDSQVQNQRDQRQLDWFERQKIKDNIDSANPAYQNLGMRQQALYNQNAQTDMERAYRAASMGLQQGQLDALKQHYGVQEQQTAAQIAAQMRTNALAQWNAQQEAIKTQRDAQGKYAESLKGSYMNGDKPDDAALQSYLNMANTSLAKHYAETKDPIAYNAGAGQVRNIGSADAGLQQFLKNRYDMLQFIKSKQGFVLPGYGTPFDTDNLFDLDGTDVGNGKVEFKKLSAKLGKPVVVNKNDLKFNGGSNWYNPFQTPNPRYLENALSNVAGQ